MAKALTAAAAALLSAIVAAGSNGMFAAAKDLKPLETAKFVEVNHANKDTAGNVAVRALPEGIAHAAALAAGQTNGTEGAPVAEKKPGFVIESNISLPESLRASRESVYPFDELQPGQSFFVPNTAEKPDAAKSLGSTVSSANARYATDDPTGKTEINRRTKATQPAKVYSRKFVVRPFTGADGVAGARVWRTV